MPDMINTIHCINYDCAGATIPFEQVEKLNKKHKHDLPDACFLTDLLGSNEDDYDDVECKSKGCKTLNDNDAKFCKECGMKLKCKDVYVIDQLDWSGSNSCETFESIFIKCVVPHISGRYEGMIIYGDEDDEEVEWKNAYFVIENGTFSYCEMHLAAAPEFRPAFELESRDDGEDDEEEDEDNE